MKTAHDASEPATLRTLDCKGIEWVFSGSFRHALASFGLRDVSQYILNEGNSFGTGDPADQRARAQTAQ